VANAAESKAIREIVGNLVALYRGDGYLRYDQRIELNFIEEDVVNAFAGFDEKGTMSVNFFKKLLEDFSDDEVVIVVCHELGHLLGNLTSTEIARYPLDRSRDPLSVEGEADYFAGQCAVHYFMEIEGFDSNGAAEKTFSAAVGAFSKLYEVDAAGQNAQRAQFPGVNTDYPDPSCRTLSVWHGAEEKQRPKCWYNP
jgi:hypothetical protein